MLRDWEEHDLYACAFCGGPFEEIEHIMPLSRGGEHSIATRTSGWRRSSRS
ncbi:HNH endonuclease [Streptomyces albipurpureus]|uniref:HNH endonuclease n=1 Tax=Streptomyces albipurpureus TaxID=2897419 RepID=A0ABT0UTF3_9ACTN|nr:HNH endonuclease [Streptomyces sp. CWNU-1]MCM2391724.1 HNH endonuclease [Streptomyces sp. CWNU-1]